MSSPDQTRLSLADYAALCALPENADRRLELVDGELVEKRMPSFVPSQIAILIAYFLMDYLRHNPLGYVTGEQGGYRLDDHTVLIPDVAYIRKERLPTPPEREAPVPPDLAVEILSPSHSKRALRQKAERYLAAGVALVWLVFPQTRQVEVYTPHSDVTELDETDILRGGDLLPNFELAVLTLFAQA